MKATLKQVVNELCGNDPKTRLFKYYLRRSLHNTESSKLILEEIGVQEIQDGFVTISFTWDNISAVNNLTNAYVDLTCPDKAFEGFD